MEWNYKKVIIKVESDGKFYFSIRNVIYVEKSLESAKSKIDEILKDYYTFSKKDINNLCKKLNEREAEFVRALIAELECHYDNAYCELGIYNENLFSF
jgi:prefoldin subunit 5